MEQTAVRFGLGVAALLILGGWLTACGPAGEESRSGPDRTVETVPGNGLTSFQIEHGIGPFTEEVHISGPIDAELAAQGEEIFQMNCEACHRLQQRFVGPALGDVLERRSATYVLNQITNPEEMAMEHPEGQRLVQEYMSIMPDQEMTREQALAIVEYLRSLE